MKETADTQEIVRNVSSNNERNCWYSKKCVALTCQWATMFPVCLVTCDVSFPVVRFI